MRDTSKTNSRRGAGAWPAALAVPVLAALALLILPAAPAAAQPLAAGPVSLDALGGENFDPAVPTPQAFLGYAPGERFTPHHRIADYCEALAAASDRVEILRYGTTYERRPLILLTISHPDNLARTDRLREAYAKLADPRRTRSLGQARDDSRNLPLAVWFSFNIHGNEASSSEAALAVAYHLAAATDEATEEWLRSTVVLLDPCLNPDGRDRYVNWYGSVAGRLPDAAAAGREHNEPWPSGRYNHYLFDLNRDWAWLTQAETRARAAAYLAWRPQVHVDFHEMYSDDTYFFFPPERPVHPEFPDLVMKWAEIFGRGNAAAFDARGWRYYTGEAFDLYYPGYGDSWPTFHGAIGMTYEQAGHGRAGVALERADGDTLTLAERVEHHYVAALATLRTAAENREARLLDFHRFFLPDNGRAPGAYLFPPGDDPPRVEELVELLMAHGAEVYRAERELRPRGMHAYDGTTVSTAVPAGTFVVPLDQPLHRFLRAVLDPEVALPDTFFYDVSAWSLPLAFGIEAYWTDAPVDGRLKRLEVPPPSTLAPDMKQGTVDRPEARYAFLIPWERNGSARAASFLTRHGVRLHYATREFRIGGRRYLPGTLVVFLEHNPEGLSSWMERAAETSGAEILGVDSGLTDGGPDLGSFRVRPLVPPRVAVVADAPASPTSVGACWFLLDWVYKIPHSLLSIDEIDEETLEGYTVLVFPDDGRGGDRYGAALDSSRVGVLKHWIRRGGVFVGLGGGGFFASADMSGLSSVKQAPLPQPDEETVDGARGETDKARRMETLTERERRERLESLPGAIFRVTVDPLHPLGFGYTSQARVLKISNRALELGPPGTNVALFTSSPRVSGYASPETEDHLMDRPFLVDEPVGRGHVVMYVEDPNFRLFWYGLNRLFLNSLFFLAE